MTYRKVEFNRLNDEFEESATLILDDTDSTQKVIDSFNAIIVYPEIDYESKKRSSKEHIETNEQVTLLYIIYSI